MLRCKSVLPSKSSVKVLLVTCWWGFSVTQVMVNKQMAQHRKTDSAGQDSAVHLDLKERNHSSEDNSGNTLAREDRWFERGVKESIHVKLEPPSLNRGGGLRHYLSPSYNAVLSSLPRQLNNHWHLGLPGLSNPHEGWFDQWPISGPDNSVLTGVLKDSVRTEERQTKMCGLKETEAKMETSDREGEQRRWSNGRYEK